MVDFKSIYPKYKEEGIKILEKLIAFESILDKYEPNSDAPFGIENKKALEYFLELGNKAGFITKNVDNYAGHLEYGEGEEILGILGHLDVVPVDKADWVSDPFKLSIRDGKMYARGSIDDKGPVVASYIALKMLHDLGFKPNKRIRLIVGCDEESGSRCLKRYLECEQRPSLGFSPDADFPLIYGEKGMMSYDIIADITDDVIEDFICGTRYNIVPALAKMKLSINLEKEYLEYLKNNNHQGEVIDGYLVAYGKASHAMCPSNGINAAFILFDFLNKYTDSKIARFVDKYLLFDTLGEKLGYDCYDEEMKFLTSNLALVNKSGNTLKIGVNCRLPLDSCHNVIKESLKIACLEFGYSYNIISESKRHYVSKDSDLVKKLMKAYKEVTGDNSEPITIGGGTYAREIGNAVAFGPMFLGREDVCHIANEYMFIEDFDKAVEIYFKAIYELTK